LCTSDQNWKYTSGEEGSQWIYEQLKDKDYRILKFSGDQDASVPTKGTLDWINALNWDVTDPWRAWSVNGQVGGYFETRNKGKFTFSSVHGAGHMVPQDQPDRAHHLITNFLQNKKI